MKQVMSRIAVVCAAALFAGAALQALNAQQPPAIKRTVLLKQDMTIPGREVVMGQTEVPPGAAEGRHTHPAELYVFVVEGTIELDREGMPHATMKAGDVFTVAPGQIHEAKNTSNAPARLLTVFVAEKGKPLTTPVK